MRPKSPLARRLTTRFPALSLAVAATLTILLGQTLSAAVTFTITPATVSNTYNGIITLQIGGLTNTETVIVQKYLDLNTNGIIDGRDWLVAQFTLTDGKAGMIIGGVTNANVPGDMDGAANGQITAVLNFANGDFVQGIVGNYLFKLSSPVGHFAPITNRFTVTNFPFGQKITGNVVSNDTSTVMSNAVVFLLSTHGSPVAGTVANNSGGYTIQMPTGTYSLVAIKSNYLCSFSTPPVIALGSGQTVTTNLTLTNATSSISGAVVDAANSGIGLPGIPVLAQSANGLLGVGFTDTNGNFNVGVQSGQWKVNCNDKSLMIHGYVGLQNSTNVSAGAADITIAVPKATALFYGSVKDNLGVPLPFLQVSSQDAASLFETSITTDANGNYALGVLGFGTTDSWGVVANDYDSTQVTNYVFTPDYHADSVNISAGQSLLWNFTGILATNHITGWLKDNYGNPITGVEIYASTTINGADYDYEMDTDSNGNYWVNVCDGDWDVMVANWPEGDTLPSNYLEPADQWTLIANNNAVVNFTATLINTPKVAIVPSGANVILTWPTNAVGLTLQSSTNLSSAAWSTVSPPPIIVNGQNTVTNPISGTERFYRLSQ